MRPVTDLVRAEHPFEVVSEYSPSGDQPQAIKEQIGRASCRERV